PLRGDARDPGRLLPDPGRGPRHGPAARRPAPGRARRRRRGAAPVRPVRPSKTVLQNPAGLSVPPAPPPLPHPPPPPPPPALTPPPPPHAPLPTCPFAETHEILGGYYLILAEDRATALRLAAQHPGALVGAVEVRPLFDLSGLRKPS